MPTIASARHDSPLGTLVSHWTAAGLYALRWDQPPTASTAPVTQPGHSVSDATRLDELLQCFFTTGSADFSALLIDSAGWTSFGRRIYHCCRQIPAGETRTYKELARAAGNERASRAVGAAMARNRIPIVIPCHRVIATGGHLRGFSAPGGLKTKQWLLALESASQPDQPLFR